MADETTEQPDLDDVMRQAEAQLEAKLEALRLSALGVAGEGEPAAAPESGDVELLPTGNWSSAGQPGEDRGWDTAWDAREPAPEGEWEDAVMRPSAGDAESDTWDGRTHRTGVTTPWQGDDEGYHDDEPADEPAGRSWGGGVELDEPAYDEPSSPRGGMWEPAPPAGPTEEELQFWAQTRTALRLLQQSTDSVTGEVVGQVSRNVEDIVRDELSAPNATLRLLQQQHATTTDRIERVIVEELEAPAASLEQLREELPAQLGRVGRDVQEIVESGTARLSQQIERDITRFGDQVSEGVDEIGRSVQEDVAQLEQSIASNVTRMAQGLVSQVGRIERSVQDGFERVEAQLEHDLKRVEQQVAEELEAPLAAVRQLQEELPARFARVERMVHEESSQAAVSSLHEDLRQLRQEHNELGMALRSDLTETRNRVREIHDLDMGEVLSELRSHGEDAVDRLTVVATDLERDRLQRVEDLELLVDSMTSGWKGLYSAVNKLLERVEGVDDRMQRVERRLASLDSMDESVERTLAEIRVQLDTNLTRMTNHINDLQPAPVMVTVQHPEATVAQTTRPGYTAGGKQLRGPGGGKQENS